MVLNSFKVEFYLSSPIILRGRLYLDAVLLALATQSGVPYQEAVSSLRIAVRDGVCRCSQLLWDGLPETVTAKEQMNIWTPREMDGYAATVSKGFVKSDRKTYKPLMDEYAAMDIPQAYFIADSEDPEGLLRAVENIPALGKWSRKGYGNVAGVTMEPTDVDPWVQPDGSPARALPADLWRQVYDGPCALSMEVVSAPYWESQRAQLCAVEKIA
jgi:hypothetical protein